MLASSPRQAQNHPTAPSLHLFRASQTSGPRWRHQSARRRGHMTVTTSLRLVLAAVLVLSASAASLAIQQADPFVGTWKLNLAKSKYDPGPAPKSTTAVYEVVQGGYKQTTDSIDAADKPSKS